MTLILDSRQIPSGDRAQAVREIVASTIVPVQIDFPAPGPIVRGAINDAGPIRFCSIRSNATKVERTPRLARDGLEPSIFVGLQMTGSSLIVQDDKEAVLRPGDLVLYDSTVPYTLVDLDGFRQHQVRIPMDRLSLPRDVIRQVAAVSLSPGHPVADLASSYFRRIANRPNVLSDTDFDAISQPSVELVRALISTHLDVSSTTKEAMHATMRLRILEYTRAHLGDPTLSATQIAAEHHISVRHLYNILAEGEVSLGDWIRAERLDACRRELRQPTARLVTIAAIAKRWGFVDASSFGRQFRAAYARSPREWRDSSTDERPEL